MTEKGKKELAKEFAEKKFVTLVADKMPVYLLLKLGRRVASTDFAVSYYYNPRHPKFHKNKRELKRAVRRAWSINAFDHRWQMNNIICNWLEEQIGEFVESEKIRLA